MDSIQYIERQSKKIRKEEVPSNKTLKWLYNSNSGKVSLHFMFKRKMLSAFVGRYMSSPLSKKRIGRFIKQYNIDLTHYKKEAFSDYKNFNDFFFREIRPDKRPLGEEIVSPADGKVLAFNKVSDSSLFFVKGSEFTLNEFIRDKHIASKYANGSMVIIRLAPTDYHRFHFPANGTVSESKKIKGRYFSVSPLALKKSLEIFCQNKREYSILNTRSAGDILISEIGATMVGSIIQTYKAGDKVEKGSEKGYFAFGGSTVVLLFEEGKVAIDNDLIENTKKGYETTVKMGENIARSISE